MLAITPKHSRTLRLRFDRRNIAAVEADLLDPVVDTGQGDFTIVGGLGDRPTRSREHSLVVQTLRQGIDVERIVRSVPISTSELLTKPDTNQRVSETQCGSTFARAGPQRFSTSPSSLGAVSSPSPDNDPLAPDDLALNRPGSTLRAKSVEIKRTHPVLVFILRVFNVHSDERAWRRGAEGEEEVAYQLRKLGDAWRVIHSVPVGTGDTDIDHVVIGPSGVFTLNTKNHLGMRATVNAKAVYVNGTFQPYIAKVAGGGKTGDEVAYGRNRT